MNTREELLSGLNDAVGLIGQLGNIQGRLNQVRGWYKNPNPHKKVPKILIVFLVIYIIVPIGASIYVGDLNIQDVIFILIKPAIIYLVARFICKKLNVGVDKRNEEIAAENEMVKEQEQTVLNNLNNVRREYRERVGYWYPENYCTLDAAEFFLDAVKNYRADNIKEAINLYETTLHQRRLEANQQQAMKEQRFANVANLIMQGAALGEMSRHNAATEFQMGETNRVLSDIQTRL